VGWWAEGELDREGIAGFEEDVVGYFCSVLHAGALLTRNGWMDTSVNRSHLFRSYSGYSGLQS